MISLSLSLGKFTASSQSMPTFDSPSPHHSLPSPNPHYSSPYPSRLQTTSSGHPTYPSSTDWVPSADHGGGGGATRCAASSTASFASDAETVKELKKARRSNREVVFGKSWGEGGVNLAGWLPDAHGSRSNRQQQQQQQRR